MKIITFQDVKNLNISPATCYEWVSETIRDKDKYILPPKISLKPRDGVFCNVMPTIGGAVGGVKVVTRYPEREPSLDSKLLLMNADSGEFLALMDADFITAMRTGAVAAHSIRLLAKTGYSTIGIMGLGNTARAALLVLLEVEKEKKFRVKLLRYKDQAESFAERFAEYKNVSFEVVDTPRDIVRGSDVVISAITYTDGDLCADGDFDEGVLVVPIHTRGFTNCDLFFDKVFADDEGHVCHFGNFAKFRSFAEVSDVVNGRVKGRENDRERILAYNIGLSIHDIFFASKIYETLSGKELKEIDLESPSEKFWV